ncbi:MAG: NAD(P)H-dependent oxidoreductase [Candidatus Paceibacterota bacterium]|jgi:putative NADPH-quinone reductase
MARTKKIFLLVANPDADSLSTALAQSYADGARAAGHEVRLTQISEMRFDPILHKGYKVIQQYEPDLIKFQEDVRWCEHFVTVFPVWWSDMPASLKGLIDRVWMPGFAFNFRKGIIPGWYRRLKGRSARVIVTSDTHPLMLWILFGGNINSYVRGALRFSGFAPLRKTWFSGMRKLSPEKAQRMIRKMGMMGRKAR